MTEVLTGMQVLERIAELEQVLEDAKRENRALEGQLDDWARSVMFATAGIVGTPDEGFLKAPYTLHRAVKELRDECKSAQWKATRAEQRLAEQQATSAALREALELAHEHRLMVRTRAVGKCRFCGDYTPSRTLTGCNSCVAANIHAALALPADDTALKTAIAAAVAAEREACAEIADQLRELALNGTGDYHGAQAAVCMQMGRLIRKRGEG